MAENTNNSAVLETEEELTSYTTETNAGAGTGTSAIAPGYGTGRRKEAVARVRLVPVVYEVSSSSVSRTAELTGHR